MSEVAEKHSQSSQSSDLDMDDKVLEELVRRLAVQTNQDDNPTPELPNASTSEDYSLPLWPSPSATLIISQAKLLGIPLICRECNQPDMPSEFVLCGGCGRPHLPAHPSCLLKKRDHQLPTTTDDSYYAFSRCEEIDFQDFIFTTKLMNTKILEQNKAVLHLEDVACTWIGVPDSHEGTLPQLNVWPRLQRLLDSGDSSFSRQHPSLVSFIGDTGSGKSTLIRAMIHLLKPSDQKLSTPVPGFTNDQFDSTSSDIHVYPDPQTLSTERPMFFVDCEGLAGAENPIARQMISSMRVGQPFEERPPTNNETPASIKQVLREETKDYINNPISKTDLRWGKTVQSPSAPAILSKESKRHVDPATRKAVVKHLYPRLLYAFSDVVCFVSNNARRSQNFLSKLIDWAKDGHERTINQQVKPALIIALNKDTEVGNAMVTTQQLTNRLLESFKKTSKYEELKSKWEARGKTIANASELLLCYYDSFSVIAIPTCAPNSPPAVMASMASRIRGLYERISISANAIYNKRLPLNAEFDIATLNAYLETSLQILGNDYRSALDFHGLSEGDLQIPTTFSEHMARSMFNLAKTRGLDNTNNVGGELILVEDFTSYVASCIVAQLPFHTGDNIEASTSVSLSKHGNEIEAFKTQKSALVNEARRGLQLFHDRYWRCEALDGTKTKRCVNYLIGHEKGHQFGKSDTGEVSESLTDGLEAGHHLCSWDISTFNDQLWREMHQLRTREEATQRRSELATGKGITKIRSQRTCLSCLANCPTNILPCRENQHGICDACIRVHCRYNEHDSVINITKCPLGCSLTVEPWTIRVKPEMAGPRILALDGGGVRGLVELSLLEKIEQEVGFGITIHELFDVVIGTSTGGIVALGVFHQKWSPTHGISVFKSLVEQAFSFRQRLEVPMIRAVIQPFCSFRYTDTGIDDALKQAFGPDAYLFGPPLSPGDRGPGDQVKVGVVACLEGRNQPCLIANYSRNPQRGEDDYLCREEDQKDDFKVWEAARATSAAPTYFKPFRHSRTNKDYKDGAFVRNNPIRVAAEEYQKIWRNSVQPDIIVSLGTGAVVKKTGHLKTTKRGRDKLKLLLPRGIRKKIETGVDMIESTLSCQREWDDFTRSISHNRRLAKNSHRINVCLAHRVEMDDAASAGELLQQCRTYLDSSKDMKAHIGTVARRLTAALFFLDISIQGRLSKGAISGVIYCRLMPHTPAARSLLAHEPVFRLREITSGGRHRVTPIKFLNHEQPFNYRSLSAEVVFDVSEGNFERFIEFKLRLRTADWEPISGF